MTRPSIARLSSVSRNRRPGAGRGLALVLARYQCGEARLPRSDDFGLEFIEDPFSTVDIDLIGALRRAIRTSIAAGEDIHGTRVMRNLAAEVDILRVDATTCGGITAAVEAIHHADGAGKTVFPHVFLPLHLHLAAAFPGRR